MAQFELDQESALLEEAEKASIVLSCLVASRYLPVASPSLPMVKSGSGGERPELSTLNR
jgi:hypothetical protein